jgi:hypothetical protein
VAQTAANSGQIVGQVVDATGAGVAGAEITARIAETNLVRRTVTDAAGRYAISLLPLSSYEVTATGRGFEAAVQRVVVTLGGGQVKDANGNYLLNSALRTSPFQAQLGLRFQF